VPDQSSFPASQTTGVTSAANDLDGDSYSYAWSVDGGAVVGDGPTATFYPPALSASQVFTVTSLVEDAHGATSSNVTFLTVSAGPGVPPPSAGLSSLAVSPASVTGGASATGTVTLTAGAPAGGAVVALSSSGAAAAVPGSVTVAAGATSATFAVTTAAVSSPTTATISASYGTATQAASLTVTPASTAALTQDAGFPTKNVYAWTSGAKSFGFTTPGANRLVVVAISYANYGQAAVTAHTVSGGGLSWTLDRQTLIDGNSSLVALWHAWVPAAGSYTASFSPGAAPRYDALLTVHAFAGSSEAGIGTVSGGSGSSSLPRIASVTTSGASSYLLAAGYDDSATTPTAGAGSTMTALDTSNGPAFWSLRSTGLLSPGTVALGLAGPTSPRAWAMAVVEVKGR
jgi:hypothetical protein